MKLLHIFERFSDIESLVKKANLELTGEAERAVDAFVGVPENAKDSGIGWGVMAPQRLEDAFSENPSERGLEIRRQLERAFVPVKQALKDKYGSTIKLYRYQMPVKDKSHRNVLSWTANPKIAQWFAGVRKLIKPLTDQEIKKAVEEYEKTGKTTVRGTTYQICEDDPDYYDIIKDGEIITDGDDLYDDLKRVQKQEQEYYEKQLKRLERVVEAEIPIDAIVWVTNRAGQQEFIVKNIPGRPWYLNG